MEELNPNGYPLSIYNRAKQWFDQAARETNIGSNSSEHANSQHKSGNSERVGLNEIKHCPNMNQNRVYDIALCSKRAPALI